MKMKKVSVYDKRVCNIEHGTFTALVFSAAGGLVPIGNYFLHMISFYIMHL